MNRSSLFSSSEETWNFARRACAHTLLQILLLKYVYLANCRWKNEVIKEEGNYEIMHYVFMYYVLGVYSQVIDIRDIRMLLHDLQLM